jgi:inhibitor of cysteine peptidase
MQFGRWLIALGIVALVLPSGVAEEKKETDENKVVATDKDNDGKVTVKKGGLLLVKLKVQGGTGFTWVVAKNDEKALALDGKPTTEKIEGENPRPGGPALLVFKFKAETEGETKLALDYKRPFEKDKEPAKKYMLTVIVK